MFEQTIFPPVEKKLQNNTPLLNPPINLVIMGVDFWFVHFPSGVSQYALCPCCGEKYIYCRFQPLVDIDYICDSVRSNQEFYFKEFMRECPNVLKHTEMDLWIRLSK